MNLGQSLKSVFIEKYATFSGRAQRSEYWWFILVYVMFFILLDTIINTTDSAFSTIAYVAIVLAIFLPSLAVAVRRLHDTNRTGWWMLLSLVPLIGTIVLIIFFCQKGTTGPNEYGADPLANETILLPES